MFHSSGYTTRQSKLSCPWYAYNLYKCHTCFEKTAATLPNESMWRGISGFHLRYLLLVQRMGGRSGTALLTSVAVPTMCQNVPLLLQKSLFHWQLTKIIQDRQLFGLAWMHSENLWIELFWYSCICSFFLVHTEPQLLTKSARRTADWKIQLGLSWPNTATGELSCSS